MLQTIGKEHGWRLLLHYMAGMVIVLAMFGIGAANAKTINMKPDEVDIVSVAGEPAAVIVGNPVFADAMVVANKRLMIQARNPGKTNIIVLDLDGNQLARFDVVVNGTDKDAMVVFNKNSRTTYVCAPECSETLNVDDYRASGWRGKPSFADRLKDRAKAIKEAQRR